MYPDDNCTPTIYAIEAVVRSNSTSRVYGLPVVMAEVVNFIADLMD